MSGFRQESSLLARRCLSASVVVVVVGSDEGGVGKRGIEQP